MSATVEFFEQDFIVGQYECDCNGRMKAGALMAQSQAISTNHCNELGLTISVEFENILAFTQDCD